MWLDCLLQPTYERENSDFKSPLSCGRIHLWKRLQEKTSRKNQEWSPYRRFDVKLWPLSGSSPRGKGTSTDKNRVVSTRRQVPTDFVFGRTLQPSHTLVTNSFVPSDFLVDDQVSGLGTVHPLITLDFFSSWILPLHVVFLSSIILGANPFGDGDMDNGGRLRIELAAGSYALHRSLHNFILDYWSAKCHPLPWKNANIILVYKQRVTEQNVATVVASSLSLWQAKCWLKSCSPVFMITLLILSCLNLIEGSCADSAQLTWYLLPGNCWKDVVISIKSYTWPSLIWQGHLMQSIETFLGTFYANLAALPLS